MLHEFAHKIDMLDGMLDGTPHLADDDDVDALGRGVHAPTTTSCARAPPARILRAYGGTNPGEFFAVATETFFTRAVSMLAEQKPDLYEVFARLLPPGPGGARAPLHRARRRRQPGGGRRGGQPAAHRRALRQAGRQLSLVCVRDRRWRRLPAHDTGERPWVSCRRR